MFKEINLVENVRKEMQLDENYDNSLIYILFRIYYVYLGHLGIIIVKRPIVKIDVCSRLTNKSLS